MQTLTAPVRSFSISFTSEGCLNISAGSACVLLELGGESERVECSLNFWSESDYITHWRHMLEKVMTENMAALVTSMVDPRVGAFVEWWPMWKVSTSHIVVRNQVLMLSQFKGLFDPSDPASFMGKRNFNNGDEQPSEWLIPIEAIQSFLNTNFLHLKWRD